VTKEVGKDMDYKLTIHIAGTKFNFMADFKGSFTKSSIVNL